MTGSRRLLVISGLLLAVFGMAYGFYYAVWVEHQTLDQLGLHLTMGFARAADRNLADAHNHIGSYAAAQYKYVRQVDAHSHWGGLATVLIVLGLAFHRVGFDEQRRKLLAVLLLLGAVAFPAAVLLETVDHSTFSKALAVVSSGMVIVAMAAVAYGFARPQEK